MPSDGATGQPMSCAEVPRFGQADLTNCDREPIHVPGSIQPHGLLLVLHPERLEVLQRAGDPARLGLGPADPGTPLAALLPAEAVARIAAPGLGAAGRALELGRPGGGLLDLALHATEAGLILEIEGRPEPEGATRPSPMRTVQAMMAAIAEAETLTAYAQAAAAEVKRVTGFDRVMIYRFEPDGTGVVIAEVREPELGPYLGLHFPASDVPRQARALYLRNRLRIIPDARYVPAPLEPALSPLTGQPTDLSGCTLRSVSPLHLEYLANMGVAASMSLSLVARGELWGLIACHHRTPHHLEAGLRAACDIFAQVFSLQIEAKEQAEDFAEAARIHRVHEDLVQVMAREERLAEGLIRQRPNLGDFLASGGVALVIEGSYAAAGRVPEEADVRAFAAWAAGEVRDGVLALDNIAEAWPPGAAFADVAAGALVLFVTRDPRDCIIWFRPEVLRTVTWAGDPNKPVDVSAGGARLSPRQSFAAWQETVRGRSQPWKQVELDAAQGLRISLLEIVLRRLEEVALSRAEARRRQDLLLAELDHRVKNTLANIQALVRHSSRGVGAVASFIGELNGRLSAMAKAHSLLSRSRWEGASLRVLVEEELGPHLGVESGRPRVSIRGPDVRLRPKAALAVSLALHELTTNAVKHGALSTRDGRLGIAWRIAGERLVLVWRESDGPAVTPPERRGFGSLVLERSLAYELGGRTELLFEPSGLVCRFDMPLRQVAEAGVVPPERATPTLRPLEGRRVLVVEDAALVAMEIESALRGAGAEVLGPFSTLPAAQRAVAGTRPDAALLDIDLDGVPVFPLAEALGGEGVPILFTTGYEPSLVLPARFAAAPVLAKPYRGEAAVAALAQLLVPG